MFYNPVCLWSKLDFQQINTSYKDEKNLFAGKT